MCLQKDFEVVVGPGDGRHGEWVLIWVNRNVVEGVRNVGAHERRGPGPVPARENSCF